jgi:hypothetical protein
VGLSENHSRLEISLCHIYKKIKFSSSWSFLSAMHVNNNQHDEFMLPILIVSPSESMELAFLDGIIHPAYD